MKREKRILKMVWEDLWVGLGLVLVLCAAQFIRSSQWNLERLRELAASSFPHSCVGSYLDPYDLFQIQRIRTAEDLYGIYQKRSVLGYAACKAAQRSFRSSYFRRGYGVWKMVFDDMEGSEYGFLGICADDADAGN